MPADSPESQDEKDPTHPSPWTWRRVVVAAIGLLLVALLVPVVATRSWSFVIYLGIGILLSATYTFRGVIPERMRRVRLRVGAYEENVWGINEPDDPSNLSYKIVVPILLVVIGGAAIAIVGLVLKWW